MNPGEYVIEFLGWGTKPAQIRSGHWCPHYAGYARDSIETMREIAAQRGGPRPYQVKWARAPDSGRDLERFYQPGAGVAVGLGTTLGRVSRHRSQ